MTEHPSTSDRVDRPEALAAELAALGESPALELELAWGSSASLDHPDVHAVVTILEWSSRMPELAGLTPFEEHRIWRQIAPRIAASSSPPCWPTGARPIRGRGMRALVSLVAAMLVVPHVYADPPGSTASGRAATRSLADAARQGLERLPGARDGGRAHELVAGYRRRLRSTRGTRP